MLLAFKLNQQLIVRVVGSMPVPPDGQRAVLKASELV